MKDIKHRITVLISQHRILEDKLAIAEKHMAGRERVNFIKRKKLAIKDEIVKLEKELSNG